MSTPERIYQQGDASISGNWSFPVDNINYPKTLKVDRTAITKNGVIEDLDGQDTASWITPNALKLTTATTSRIGVIGTATNEIAGALTDTTKALTSSNMPTIFDNVLKITNSYVLSNIQDTAGCTVTSITGWFESAAGGLVFGNGTLNFTVPADTKRVSIRIDSTNLPIIRNSGYGDEVIVSSGSEPISISVGIETFGGEVLLSLTRNVDNWLNSDGEYKVSFGYQYLKSQS